MKHLQRLRKMVTLAFHMEWLEKDPFIRWKPTWEKKEREHLSENELSNLETYYFPIERLERVRDLFVLYWNKLCRSLSAELQEADRSTPIALIFFNLQYVLGGTDTFNITVFLQVRK